MKVLYKGAVWRAESNRTKLRLKDLFRPCRDLGAGKHPSPIDQLIVLKIPYK